jgi:hypothetical protein
VIRRIQSLMYAAPYAFWGAMVFGLVVALLLTHQSCVEKRGNDAGQQAQQHIGEANTHANQAQAIPDHAEELEATKKDVAGARAEVARLRKLLEAKPGVPVPDPVGPDSPNIPTPPPDHRDEVIAAQDVLITKLDGQVLTLETALRDEQKRSGEFKAAFESERKAFAAQEAATKAWKDAVNASRWQGRIEGFAVGVASGYLAGKMR